MIQPALLEQIDAALEHLDDADELDADEQASAYDALVALRNHVAELPQAVLDALDAAAEILA
jgi:hypothetical protein